MKIQQLPDSYKPSFCYDRNWDCGEIRSRLSNATGAGKVTLVAWILREGTPNEIWNLVKPGDVYTMFHEIEPFLYTKKNYWRYTFDVWKKLGKL